MNAKKKEKNKKQTKIKQANIFEFKIEQQTNERTTKTKRYCDSNVATCKYKNRIPRKSPQATPSLTAK